MFFSIYIYREKYIFSMINISCLISRETLNYLTRKCLEIPKMYIDSAIGSNEHMHL